MKSIVLAFACVFFATLSYAQTSGTLRMVFQDSRTGTAVQPDRILINGRDETTSVAPEGVLAVGANDGDYEVRVTARGYMDATVSARVEGADTLVQTVELDPTQEVEEPEVEPGTGVLSGTVVDDESGKLLPDVKLSVPEEHVTSNSDVRGQFELLIPVSGRIRETLPSRKVTLVAELPRYRAEHRKNVEVFALNRKRYILRLQPISQETSDTRPLVVDEDKQFEVRRVRGWAFDVGVR